MSSEKGLKVKEHPDEDLISKMLLSGWSPKKIELYLRDKYPTDESKWISEHTLLDYRKNFINLGIALPASYYAQKLKELDVAIDSLQELYNQVEIQKRRVAYNLKVEDGANIALPDTRHEMEVLHTMLVNIITLEMKLGIRKETPQKLEVLSLSLDKFLSEFLEKRKAYVVDGESPSSP